VDEAHRQIVLLLNHVLMQEPQATERLARQKGRVGSHAVAGHDVQVALVTAPLVCWIWPADAHSQTLRSCLPTNHLIAVGAGHDVAWRQAAVSHRRRRATGGGGQLACRQLCVGTWKKTCRAWWVTQPPHMLMQGGAPWLRALSRILPVRVAKVSSGRDGGMP